MEDSDGKRSYLREGHNNDTLTNEKLRKTALRRADQYSWLKKSNEYLERQYI